LRQEGVHAENAEEEERRRGVAPAAKPPSPAKVAAISTFEIESGFTASATSLRLNFLLCVLCVNPF